MQVREELLSGQYEVVVTTYEVINIEKTYLKRFSWRWVKQVELQCFTLIPNAATPIPTVQVHCD